MPPSIPPARAVSRAMRPSRTHDLVVGLRPGPAGRGEPVADLHALHRLDAHQRQREAGVELAVVVHVRAEPGRRAVRQDLEDPADGVLRPAGAGRSRRPSRVGASARPCSAPARRRSRRRSARAGRARPAGRFTLPICTTCERTPTPSSARNALQQAPDGHPRRRLAGARPLQDVADVVEPVLLRAHQVRVTRPRPGETRFADPRRPRRPSGPRTSPRTRRWGW